MKVQAIVPAGGEGRRFGGATPKLLTPLGGVPLLIHTLRVLDSCPLLTSIIIAAHRDLTERMQELVDRYAITKIATIVSGGNTRRESVACGLTAVAADTERVLIHDMARPLISSVLLDQILQVSRQEAAVITGVPVTSTIKQVDVKSGYVQKTLDRNLLWEIQTPQVFAVDVLRAAHQRAADMPVTDDAMLVEAMGRPVKVVKGSYRNIKITTPEDMMMAEAFLHQGAGSPGDVS